MVGVILVNHLRRINKMVSSRIFFRFLNLISICAVFSLLGCAGKKAVEEAPVTPTMPAVEDTTLGDSDSGKALGLQTVNFAYDSYVLGAEAKKTLESNASILKEKGSTKIQVEGHCDVRGGIQYNIALGEKRAMAAKKYLEDHGIADSRISTISYGKERLLDAGTTEAAHAKNRRANFVITSR
ncbi:MAG: OmpA family protein [Bdellovibrio sp.]|nr:OmpA family protein [Bdellovibrio sp.]